MSRSMLVVPATLDRADSGAALPPMTTTAASVETVQSDAFAGP
jgi:hypothetical protein